MLCHSLCLIALAAGASFAADISGTWTGTMQIKTPDGQAVTQKAYFRLKQDGASLTGRAGISPDENAPIQGGKVENGVAAFEFLAPNGVTGRFKLRIDGDAAMKGTVAFEGRATLTGTIEMNRGEAASAGGVRPGTAVSEVKPYDNVRVVRGIPANKDIRQADLSGQPEILPTLDFNQKTVWPEPARMPAGPRPADLLKAAMDPGLGIRQLHAEGITGKGVSVAIIDQPLIQDHPEYAGKIAAYREADSPHPSSMHGPSVASLLVGTNIGTAPGATLYFAAMPDDGKGDAIHFATALDWIVEQNRKLPPAARIRVVSVSAAPSGEGSLFKTNNETWDPAVRRAEAEGILVLDCTRHRAVIGACWFPKGDRENPAGCVPGFPGFPFPSKPDKVLSPAAQRTTAEVYAEGDFGYVYWGRGGLSWSVPYAAGVLALGWQVRPELTGRQALDLLLKSAYQTESGARIINPREFIRAVKQFGK